MSKLDTFVAPRPNRAMIGSMKWVNRIVMLRGLPVLRDIPWLNRVPPFRGLANIRHIDLPAADEARLVATVGKGRAVLFAPNHPEFFTDWMIDKEILSRVAPLAASWATNGVVNGMGDIGQKFWLANNLIAQIPGNSEPAKEHSIAWAVAGHGVLLHPEGGVGWHADCVAPLLPGTIEMGLEALARSRKTDPDFEVWIAPVVWKLKFLRDVEPQLAKECTYVERRLKIEPGESRALPDRIYHIYNTLLSRDEERLGLPSGKSQPCAARVDAAAVEIVRQLRQLIATDAPSETDVQRAARRWLRDNKSADQASQVKSQVKALSDTLARLRRVGPFAFDAEQVTQEHLAEHIKRLRTDYCKGTLRDTLAAMLPQPAGARWAIIRVPELIGLHDFSGSPEAAVALLHSRLQSTLDRINEDLKGRGAFKTYANPFFHRVAAKVAA